MARTNMQTTRIKPQRSELLVLHVLRRQRLSSGFMRVTLGGGDISRFVPLGGDQWFRLFLPVGGEEDALNRLPAKLDVFAFARYLAISKAVRPVLRNYSVRAFRPDGVDGPELEVDFVLHGSAAAGTSGPAASWAQTCAVGDAVAIVDEGISFTPAPGIAHVRLVADETGVPAAANILSTLAAGTRGTAVLEVPHADDIQPLSSPDGVDVHWVVREDPHAVPGIAAGTRARLLPTPGERFYGWVAGESALAIAMRRHWIATGVAKEDILFCGYWKAQRR
ncbi:siderophore-interacting protein [Leifsonia sp. LS1]|uniref:siderophore-interacting protein n=1 Tax=Leifsonia sp. LS1 TaxID=2828483 RepID=UPI001CFECA6C|nr:siderophore-interacting protein [Leifsonia sp. LS1]GIT79812.1 siderophore-interacting protein [Leifsonia sp. LS1]